MLKIAYIPQEKEYIIMYLEINGKVSKDNNAMLVHVFV